MRRGRRSALRPPMQLRKWVRCWHLCATREYWYIQVDMNPILSSRVLQTLRPLMLFLSGAATMGLLIMVFEISNDQPVISRVTRHDKHDSSLQSFPSTSRYTAGSSGFLSLPESIPSSPQPSHFEKPSNGLPPSPLNPLTSGHEPPTAVISSDMLALQGSPPLGMSRWQKPTAGLQPFQEWLQSHNVHARGTLKRDQVAHIAASPRPVSAKKLRSISSSHYTVSNVQGGIEITLPPLLHVNDGCTSSICSKYLSKTEKIYFDKCLSQTVAAEEKFGQIRNGTCHFTNGTGRYPVALASFPGAGNTWVRGLLEKATGICTGALYCDGGLRTKGFTGEGIRGPSVLVIKDHGAGTPLFTNNKLPKRILNNKPVYGGTVLLVRNPRHCMIAEWHRERSKRLNNMTASNHFLHVGAEYFGNNSEWSTFLHEKAVRWPVHIATWIINGRNNPFHVVRYEDLKMNATREVIKLLKFLGVPHSEEEVNERLKLGFSDFYRNHHDEFTHFIAEQEHFISSLVNQTISILKVYGLNKVFPIHEYL